MIAEYNNAVLVTMDEEERIRSQFTIMQQKENDEHEALLKTMKERNQ